MDVLLALLARRARLSSLDESKSITMGDMASLAVACLVERRVFCFLAGEAAGGTALLSPEMTARGLSFFMSDRGERPVVAGSVTLLLAMLFSILAPRLEPPGALRPEEDEEG